PTLTDEDLTRLADPRAGAQPDKPLAPSLADKTLWLNPGLLPMVPSTASQAASHSEALEKFAEAFWRLRWRRASLSESTQEPPDETPPESAPSPKKPRKLPRSLGMGENGPADLSEREGFTGPEGGQPR